MALDKYYAILARKQSPAFIEHRKKIFRILPKTHEMFFSCELCERRCRVDRRKERGFCGAPDHIVVSSIFPHYGEEHFFVPSLTVFFYGCTFECVFCQNWEIARWKFPGRTYSPKELAEELDAHGRTCRNFNFVGGEPTPYTPLIMEALTYVDTPLPVLWNSNMYFTEEAFTYISLFTDVYLSDWKYGNNKCAERLSSVRNYTDVVIRNHDLAFKHSDVVIRHLVMPRHVECCTFPVLEEIASRYGDNVVVNIMGQYHPDYRAHEFSDIEQFLTQAELEKARRKAESLGLNWIS